MIHYQLLATDMDGTLLNARHEITLENQKAIHQAFSDGKQVVFYMLNAIQMGIVTASTKTRLEKLEKQKEELQVSILQAQLQRPNYTKEQIVSWINRFKYRKADDPNYQRQIIDTFLNAIYVYDDKLVFTYNFKDGTETMSLDDAEAVFYFGGAERENRKQNAAVRWAAAFRLFGLITLPDKKK